MKYISFSLFFLGFLVVSNASLRASDHKFESEQETKSTNTHSQMSANEAENDLFKIVEDAISPDSPCPWRAEEELTKRLNATSETVVKVLREILLNKEEIPYTNRVLFALKNINAFDASKISKDFYSNILGCLALQQPDDFLLVRDTASTPVISQISDQDVKFKIYKEVIQKYDSFGKKIKLARELVKEMQYMSGIDHKMANFLFERYYEFKQVHPHDHGAGYEVEQFFEEIFKHQEKITQLEFDTIIQGSTDITKLVKFAAYALTHKPPFYQTYVNRLQTLRADELFAHGQKILKTLPIISKSGVQPLHERGFCGQGVGIAVCDTGFSKALFYQGNKKYDEFIYAWDRLQNKMKTISDLRSYGRKDFISSQDSVTGSLLNHHGESMIGLICAIAPGATIYPCEIDETAESWVNCFEDLANDDRVQVISVSWALPGLSFEEEGKFLIHPKFKKALMKCLQNDKIVVPAAGNTGRFIPQKAGIEENPSINSEISEIEESNNVWISYNNGHHRISDLFSNEPEDSLLFSSCMIVGSTRSNSIEGHKQSVKSGKGSAQKQYTCVDGDEVYSYFDDPFNGGARSFGWGGTSSATAAASGIVANLLSAKEAGMANSKVLEAILKTCDISEHHDVTIEGNGKINPLKALTYLGYREKG